MEFLFYFIFFYFFMETRNHLYRWSLVIEEEEEALPRIEPSKSYFWHYSTRRCNNMLIMLNQVNKYKNTLKTEIKPIFRENTNFEKHGCQNSVPMITSILKYTSRQLKPFPVRGTLTCSQTLYFLFKIRRARVIKYKSQGIY